MRYHGCSGFWRRCSWLRCCRSSVALFARQLVCVTTWATNKQVTVSRATNNNEREGIEMDKEKYVIQELLPPSPAHPLGDIKDIGTDRMIKGFVDARRYLLKKSMKGNFRVLKIEGTIAIGEEMVPKLTCSEQR